MGCTPFPFTVVAIPGEHGNTTKGGNSSNVAYTLSNSDSVSLYYSNEGEFRRQGEFRSGFAQQCASGVTDTFVFCVGETESDVYSLTVYDTAQPAVVVLVHDAPRYFDVGAGSGGMVFTAYQPGMLLVGVGTVLYLVDVTSPEDPKSRFVAHLTVAQIVGVKCSGEHIAVHAVEPDGVQERVYVYRFVVYDSMLEEVGEIAMNVSGMSWDINGGVFAVCYEEDVVRHIPVSGVSVATIGDTISVFKNINFSEDSGSTDFNYRVNVLADGAIAVFYCTSMCGAYRVKVSYDGYSFNDVFTGGDSDSENDTWGFIKHAEMVTLDRYVFLTSAVSLYAFRLPQKRYDPVLSWEASFFLDYTPMQITFTRGNPAANNVIMLTVAALLVCVCLFAQLFLSEERLGSIVTRNEDTASTQPAFLVHNNVLKRGSMWAEMPTTSQSVTTEK